MLCALCRWQISRAEDTGRPLAPFAARHVRRCRRCGDYARSIASIASRLRAGRPDFLAAAPEIAVDLASGCADIPAAQKAARAPRRSWSGLRPWPVAAAVLAVVAAALVLFRVVPREPGPAAGERMAALAALRTIASAPGEISGALQEAESPLDRERRVLERSVASAVEFLQARLNIKIERREPPAKAG
jgi:hypothetical protein